MIEEDTSFMTNRERIVNALHFKPVDRLPMVEWAAWWNKTIQRWQAEGLPAGIDVSGYWKLDDLHQFWISSSAPELAAYKLENSNAYIRNEADYEKILPALYPEDAVIDNWIEDELVALKAAHEAGEAAVWMSLDGYFWWPRILFGIEPHLYSFYDYPELYHRICNDLADFQLKIIEEFCSILAPEFMTIAEDMSYNHGPMLSEGLFNEFIRPYYEKIIPALHQHGVKVIIDTDGNVMPMIPWLLRCGIDGILPLERQSAVDANFLRETYPDLIMLGAFDKRVMKQGEAAMRKEFERLAPVMQSGGFIPSVDHQTPPDVSLENYRVYVRLLREYCRKAK